MAENCFRLVVSELNSEKDLCKVVCRSCGAVSKWIAYTPNTIDNWLENHERADVSVS